MRSFLRLTSVVLLALALGASAGCKQSLGERCQIDEDCEEGLFCSTGEPRTCQNRVGGTPDAGPPAADGALPADAAPTADVAPGADAVVPDAAGADAVVADAALPDAT